MSDKPISVGDLVMILPAPNPGCAGFVGQIRTVARLCRYHRGNFELSPPTINPFSQIEISWVPRRLKRIPPLEELESEKRDEEITA